MTLLDPEARQRIATLAERMVPRSQDMPGASDLALAEALLDRVLEHRPDLRHHLEALPDLGTASSADVYLSRLEVQDPSSYQALLQAVLGAYYLHPEVKRRLGYYGQQAMTLPRGDFGGAELLEQMMSKPPRFRDPSRR